MGRTFVLAILTVALLAPSAGCRRKASSCDREGLGKLVQMQSRVRDEDRSKFWAQGVVESCGKGASTLPSDLKKGLEARYQAPPALRDLAAFGAAASLADLWTKACPSGPGVLADAVQVVPAEKVRMIVDRCGLARQDLASGDELARADASALVLAVLLHRWMIDTGNGDDLARSAARGILAF